MWLNVRTQYLLLTVYIFLAIISSVVTSSKDLKNIAKFDLKGWKPIHTLRVSTIQYEPFMHQNENGKLHNGIEFKLIKTIAEKEQLNLSIQFQNDFKSTHFNQLLYNEYDIMVGGLFPNITTFDIFAGSRPYFQDDFTWCIQKSRNYPMIINAFLAVAPECWFILIFGVAYGTGLVIYIMVQFDLKDNQRNKRDWHYTLILITLPGIIGFNQRFKPKSTSLRIFYGFILIMMIVIWQIVYFKAIRFIKVPMQRPQIATVEGIANHDYQLYGSLEVQNFIRFDERYKESQIHSFVPCPSIDRCLADLKHLDNDYLAVGASRQRILNSRSYLPSKIFCFDRDESIASYQPALLMRNDFTLRKRIDHIIQNAFEGGLFVKWERDSQRKKKRIDPIEPEYALTLEQYAVFLVVIYSIGCIMAILSFIAEILIQRKLKQEQKSPIWTYFEQFFDGNRHYLKDLPARLTRGGGFRLNMLHLLKFQRFSLKLLEFLRIK